MRAGLIDRLPTGVRWALATAGISGVAVFLNGLAVKASGGPALHTASKNAVAAVVLGAALAAATRRGAAAGWTPPVTRAQRAGLAFVALVGGGVAFVLFFEGLFAASSTDAAVLHKSLVLWVALLAPVALGERVGWPVVAGVAGLLAGQVVLAGDLSAVGLGRPEAMILAATLLWSVEVLVSKRLLADLSPLSVGTVRLAGGLAVLAGWLVASGALDGVGALGAAPWLWALGTGVVLAGYVACWLTALSRAPATVVTAVLVLAVPITATLDAVLRGEPVAGELVGLGLIVAAGGAVVAAARARRAAPSAPVPGIDPWIEPPEAVR